MIKKTTNTIRKEKCNERSWKEENERRENENKMGKTRDEDDILQRTKKRTEKREGE